MTEPGSEGGGEGWPREPLVGRRDTGLVCPGCGARVTTVVITVREVGDLAGDAVGRYEPCGCAAVVRFDAGEYW